MTSQFYFISGLPRAGSTLLSAILSQNPRFHSSISSPVSRLISSAVHCLTHIENKIQCTDAVSKNVMKSIVSGYYENLSKEVIFDTSRGWVQLSPMLNDIYPYTKVIVCVRDIMWILDSFEVLYRKHKYAQSTIYTNEERLSVYTRCTTLMRDNGVIGYPYSTIKEILSLPERSMLLFVEYEDLCKFPENTMRNIYNFIDQPYFDHNFNNVEYSNDEFDSVVNAPGLHTTRKSVSWIERKSILPQDIIRNFLGAEVWRPGYPGSIL